MLPPLKQELVSNSLEPWRDGHSAPLLRLSQQLLQLLCTHIAMTLDLISIGCHGNVPLDEEDVVDLMLAPRGIRLGLVVDPGQVGESV